MGGKYSLKFNSSPLKWAIPKGKELVFQPAPFSGAKMLVSGMVTVDNGNSQP